MTVRTKVIGRKSTYHDEYVSGQSYGKSFQVTLFGCVWESKHENNNTAPAVWDGGDTITPNNVDWKQISGSYESWLLDHDRPAQSEDYPYNGMGYVMLRKNIQEVNGVEKNLLTQDMFYKDDPDNIGQRVPNTNTIFEVRYGFELAEDVTIPSGSELRFVGGKISGAHTLTGQNTAIEAGNEAIFGSNVLFAGTFCTLRLEWFGIMGTNANNTTLFNSLKSRIDYMTIQQFEFCSNITFASNNIVLPRRFRLNGNNNKLIFTSTTGTACLFVSETNVLTNIVFNADSQFDGAVIENNTSVRDGSYPVCQFRMENIQIIGTWRADYNFNLIGMRFVCTNNHALGGDGYDYITTDYVGSVVIAWVKTGIDIKLENVDVQSGNYAWMNDFFFNYAFIQFSQNAVIVDNRDSSTQNPTQSSGKVSFGMLDLQASNNSLVGMLLYNAEVYVNILWPWDMLSAFGKLFNRSVLMVGFNGRYMQNITGTDEDGNFNRLNGFKLYDTSKIYILEHGEKFSLPIYWDNYDPTSGMQVTRIRANNGGVGFVQMSDVVPLSVNSDSTYKANLSLGSPKNNYLLSNIGAERGKLFVHGFDTNGDGKIISQWKNLTWDGVCACWPGQRNSRRFFTQVGTSQGYSSNKCIKLTYTPYVDSDKQIPLLSKLTFSRVNGFWSENKNIADITKVEVNGNSIEIYIETKVVTSANTKLYFDLEFSNTVSYSHKPSVDDLTAIVQDDLSYMPAAATSSMETVYYTKASSTARPSSSVVPYVGFIFFDTTLNKPIWWTGSEWVDATGTTV